MAQTRVQSATVATELSVSLLDVQALTEDEWFSTFLKMKDELAMNLVLVAVLQAQNIIQTKESTSDQKQTQIVNSFLRQKSLFSYRSQLRGLMGLPRIRQDDLDSSWATNRRKNRFTGSFSAPRAKQSKEE